MFKGLFDMPFRLEKIARNGDPLLALNGLVNWELFRPTLEIIREKPRKSDAGAKGYDPVLMFKMLVLQSLYNLSDEALEFQVLDRLSFMRFLGLTLADDVPDCTTVWRFREALAEAGLEKVLFEQFDAYLRDNGFAARKGQIVDASIIEAPRQRNTREENTKIKEGQTVEGWSDAKRAQKDTDARWTKKNNVTYFGYKNHVAVDVKGKFIRAYDVTDASVHDSQVFEQLLDATNTGGGVWADSAYPSEETLARLAAGGFTEHLHRKARRGRELTERQKRANTTRSRVRCRVEHVFGTMTQRAGDLLIRTIGIVRARCKIGLRNLTYNIGRYAMLTGHKEVKTGAAG